MINHHSGEDSHNNNGIQVDDLDEQQSMEAVRNLLFGREKREIGGQISDLEKRLRDQIDGIEDRLNNRLNGFEDYIKRELGETRNEVESRRAGLDERMEGIDSRLGSEVNRVENEYRGQIAERAKALSDEISDVSKGLHERVDSLRKDATSKSDFGGILVEMGKKMVSKGE